MSFGPVVARRTARVAAACGAVALMLAPTAASAALTPFVQDAAGFAAATDNAAVTAGFDDVAAGSEIGGQSFGGATFTAPGAPLTVVDAASTATVGTFELPYNQTNRLFASTGGNVLSPGGAALGPGADPAVENDDLRIDFASPVAFVGFDHLAQRLDGQGFTRVAVINAAGDTVLDEVIPISTLDADAETGIIPGGVDFWGIVSDDNDIAALIFNEVDEDANGPDSNVGYDSFRFGVLDDGTEPPPPPTAIPLPAAIYAMPLLFGLAEIARRRMRT
jgi:hypothetical protein